VNAVAQTGFAAGVAKSVAGSERVDAEIDGAMTGEDFAYMLLARPGAYILMGNGDTSQLHSDTYDFNDEALPYGVSYWAKLVEMALPVQG
jgi:metal-dependent amidase/aminoacylase/carboxypeptidase family protein